MASPGRQQGSSHSPAGCMQDAADAARHDESRMVANNKHVSSSSALANTPSAAHCHPADQSEGDPKGTTRHERAHPDPMREKEEGELEDEQNELQQLHGMENGGQVAGLEGDRDKEAGGGSSDGGEKGKSKREGKSKRSKEDKKSKETEEERRARKEERRARRETEGRGHGHKKRKSATRERDEGEDEARDALPESGRGAEGVEEEEHPLGPQFDPSSWQDLAAGEEGGDDYGYSYEGQHGRSRGAGHSSGSREERDKRARLEEEEMGYEEGYEGQGYEDHRYGYWEDEYRQRGSSRHSNRKEEDYEELVSRHHSRRSSGREEGRREEGSRHTDRGGSSKKRAAELDLEAEEAVYAGGSRGPGSNAYEEREGKKDRGRDDSRHRSSGRREGGDEERERRRGEEVERYSRSHREDKYSSRREEEEGRHSRRHYHRGEDRDRVRDREREKGRDRDRDRDRERREGEREKERGDDRRERDRGERGEEGRRDRERREERHGHHKSSKRQRSPRQEEEVELPGEHEEDEQAAIEARRNRIAALKAKHQQQASTINPTATALQQQQQQQQQQEEPSGTAGAAGTPGAAQPVVSASGAVSGGGAANGYQRQQQQQASSAPAGMDVDGEAEDTAGARPGFREGTATPEGDRTSSEEPEGGLRPGPMLQIWGANDASNMGPPDEADSGAPAGLGSPRSKGGVQGPGISGVGGAASSMALTEENAGKTTAQERIQATAATTAKHKLAEADDMFAEELSGDDDDMFAERPEGGDEGEREREGAGGLRRGRGGGALKDAYDDHEGYYNFQVGEVMDKRYEVFACHGKGVFSVVVRARDVSKKDQLGQHPEVAIKLIRANETMYKAAQMELAVLHRLGLSDPENRKHCIRLLRHFEYRNHMCLVFEPMAFNLRELTKKYGRNKGLNVEAVQLFSCQLLIALRHLKKNEVLHADIKPDNILINQRHNKVKLCDFGSAMMAGENEVTPYLVSRFYRPPEVIMGMKYDYALDMWSVGAVIYELFTGRILFPGHSNNQMLKLMMDVKGGFTKKMLRKCVFAEKHFEMHDPSCPFISLEDDPITKTKVRKLVASPAVKHNFTTLLSQCSGDKAKVAMLADLLEKMMMLEPERRIDPDAALRHPFVKAFLPKRDSQHGGKRH